MNCCLPPIFSIGIANLLLVLTLQAQTPRPISLPTTAGNIKKLPERKFQIRSEDHALPAPSQGQMIVRKVTGHPCFEEFEFAWLRGSAQIRGVLLLGGVGTSEETLTDTAWIDFAKARSWMLVSFRVKRSKEKLVPDELGAFMTEQVKTALDDALGVSRPAEGFMHIFARDTAALPLSQLLLSSPASIGTWAILDAAALPPTTLAAAELPPGLLAASHSGFTHKTQFWFEDLRSANPESRITLLCRKDGDLLDGKTLPFVRSFLQTASVDAAALSPIWINTGNKLTRDELLVQKKLSANPDPRAFAWLPDEKLATDWKKLHHGSAMKARPLGQNKLAFTSGKGGPFDLCEFHWIKHMKPEQNPKGILLVASTSLPSGVLRNDDWLQFAASRELSIVLVGLQEAKRVVSQDGAARTLEQRFFKWLDSRLGKDVKAPPILAQAQGQAAYWMQHLIQRQPTRFKGWVCTNPPRFPAVPLSLKLPPGLILSSNIQQFDQALHYFEDTRGADSYNPLNLLSLPPDKKIPNETLDDFCRLFLGDSLIAKKETIRWLHLHDLKPLGSALIEKPDPRQFAWFPSQRFMGAWKALRRQTQPTPLPTIVKRSFKTKLPEVPELKLFVRIPGSLKKGEAPTGVLCFCTWQQEDTTIVNRLKSNEDSLVTFADRRGMAMITWNTASMLPTGTKVFNITEEQEADIQRKFTAFGEEWRNAIRKVSNEFKLQDKDMLLYGISRGATFAHQISMRYPEQFLAVHTHIGSRYNDSLPKEAKDTFWLVTTGETDGGYGDSFQLYTKLKELGAPVLFKGGENLGHSSRRDIEELGAAFFTHALDLHRRCEREKEKNRLFKDTPRSLYLNSLAAPPFFGDYINHQTFRASDSELDTIPVEQRLPLPTESIAKAWGMSLEEVTAKRNTPKNFVLGK